MRHHYDKGGKGAKARQQERFRHHAHHKQARGLVPDLQDTIEAFGAEQARCTDLSLTHGDGAYLGQVALRLCEL